MSRLTVRDVARVFDVPEHELRDSVQEHRRYRAGQRRRERAFLRYLHAIAKALGLELRKRPQ